MIVQTESARLFFKHLAHDFLEWWQIMVRMYWYIVPSSFRVSETFIKSA